MMDKAEAMLIQNQRDSIFQSLLYVTRKLGVASASNLLTRIFN